ncbi:MAG: formylglycine-generating enzyme family protein [Spirochaetaceae bacterium]
MKRISQLLLVTLLVLGCALDDESESVDRTVMVSITGGTFQQATDFNHTISDFSIGKYEVTYGLWYEVYSWAIANEYVFANEGTEGHDGSSGAAPTTAEDEPVTEVNWRDMIIWCNAYSEKNDVTPVYEDSLGNVIKNSSDSNAAVFDSLIPNNLNAGYRLPTEGEWLFAARGGNISNSYIYSGSNTIDDVAWYYDNSYSIGTHNVGEKQANELGLYDMTGNVTESCFDGYTDYPSDTTDYIASNSYPDSDFYRIYSGGCWSQTSDYCEFPDRDRYNSRSSSSGTTSGFRIAQN